MGSRAELLATIEKQKEQLHKYQTKLRDVVAAYKGLQAEKAALEASVTALSADTTPSKPRSKEPKVTSPPDSEHERTETDDDEAKQQQEDEEGDENSDHQGEVDRLREQLKTLTASLATVSQEKSKMQASFQADKKKIRQEQEEQITLLEEEKEQKMQQIKDMQEQLNEWKQRVRSAQHEREKEQDDHALMLRELQKLLAKERAQRETTENQLDDAKQALLSKETSPDVLAEYERRITRLTAEIRTHQDTIRALEAKAQEPSPQLQMLQKELAEVKAQHRIQLQYEQRRAVEAEDSSKTRATESEQRISSLESKIAELSGVVGTYEKQRCQDQATVGKMRERITQLDMENTALAKAAHSIGSDIEEVDETQDVQSIVDKISRLKAALKLANEKTDKPVDIQELLQDSTMEADVHHACQEELAQVKEEFERYKLRAQSVLKNKNAPKESISPEVESLKGQVTDLKERLRFLRHDYEEQVSSHEKKEETLRKTIEALQEKQKQDMLNQETVFKSKITDLEGEVRKHRNRTISLLAEKDREIEMLRENSPEKLEAAYLGSYRSPSVSSDPAGAASSEQDVFAELFSRTGSGTTLGETTALLHFAQEQARKDVEIAQHRRHKHSLEQRVRELQQAAMVSEEEHGTKVEQLQEEIRKLERNKNRESANLEYLKNVVYHYMVCQDALGKQQMLRAIATILQFSPKESEKVMTIINGGWWGGGGGASPAKS